MAVPMSDEQRKAAAALLRERIPAAAEFGRLFARHGYQLALVGGLVRDVFLGKLDPAGDRDLTTDATPEEVLAIAGGWADKVWTIGIAFGTVGLRKGNSIFEVTTYRSERYDRTSRRPVVTYGRSLEEDLSRRDFTINAMAAKLPDYELVDPFGGVDALQARVLRTPGRPRGLVQRRPAAHPAGRPVRGQAGLHGRRRGAGGDDRAGGPAGDPAGRADHRRADQADAHAGSRPGHRPDGPDRRGRPGAARGVQAADGGRRAPPAQGRLPAQPDRAAAGHRARAGVRPRRRPGGPAGRAAARHRQAEDPDACCRTGGWRSTCTRWSGRSWPGAG